MGDGMQNLQQLEIEKAAIDTLPQIIGSFQKLKSLKMGATRTAETNWLIPSRQNESLEELEVRIPFCHSKKTYDAINACTNLKRLDLSVNGGLTVDFVACIRQLAHLKHLHFADQRYGDALHQRPYENPGPLLVEIIEHFRLSPDFVELQIFEIPPVEKQLVEDLFEEDLDKVQISVCNSTYLLINKQKKV